MARIVIEHLRGNALRLTILVVCLLAVAPALTSAGPLPSLPTQNLPPQLQQPVNQAQNTVNNAASQAGGTVQHVTQQARSSVNRVTNSSGGSGGTGGGNNSGSNTSNPGTGNNPTGSGKTGGPGGNGKAARKARARRAAARRAAATRAALRRRRAAAAAAARRRGTGGVNGKPKSSDGGPGVLKPIREIIKIIPTPLKIVIGALALVALAALGRSFVTGRRAKWLARERDRLMNNVGLFQRALLPRVAERIGPLETSVSYRPAQEETGAGGDFYDVFELQGDRVAIIVGDVCGHGEPALNMTSLMRFSLRQQLTLAMQPRVALQVVAKAFQNDPHAELTTMVAAVYDRSAGTLTYACAGHEPPIVLGPAAHTPLTVGSSPPVGVGLDTGLRQTTVPFPPGSSACFFTDGLVEARLGNGLLGRDRLVKIARELGREGSADDLVERVANRADRSPDDMAACIVRATADAPKIDGPRIEELEVDGTPGDEERVQAFLAACRMPSKKVASVLQSVRAAVAEHGGAIVHVEFDTQQGRAEVVPHAPGIEIATNGKGGMNGAHIVVPAPGIPA
ncbi:MAG: serine/threonine-protein phosphatase [Actinobacteria bacterium]|nr:MAG: serine/threonine-protein phosphatase [Actinomycetota bacterium]